jgi:hypothetical protein
MNRRFMWLAAVLLFTLALRFAFAQGEERAITWEPAYELDPMGDVLAVMVAAPLLGLIFAALRRQRTNSPRPLLQVLRLR